MGNLTETKNIRNVCLLGHGGNGKTSLAEAMLHLAKASERFGKVTEGNTVCDFDAEEIKRKFSLKIKKDLQNHLQFCQSCVIIIAILRNCPERIHLNYENRIQNNLCQ